MGWKTPCYRDTEGNRYIVQESEHEADFVDIRIMNADGDIFSHFAIDARLLPNLIVASHLAIITEQPLEELSENAQNRKYGGRMWLIDG